MSWDIPHGVQVVLTTFMLAVFGLLILLLIREGRRTPLNEALGMRRHVIVALAALVILRFIQLWLPPSVLFGWESLFHLLQAAPAFIIVLGIPYGVGMMMRRRTRQVGFHILVIGLVACWWLSLLDEKKNAVRMDYYRSTSSKVAK